LAGGVLAGTLAVGTGALASGDLDRRRAELTRLSADLTAREAALKENQARVAGQAETIRNRVSEASALADQLVSGQGSVLDRLKKAAAAVRQLREDLRGIQTSE
jgi:hypothetical protein